MSLNLSYIFINIPNLKLECLFAAPQIALIFQYNRLSAKSKDLKFHPHTPHKKSARIQHLRCTRTDFSTLFCSFLFADACGDQYSGDHFLRGLLHGDRYRIRTAAVGKSSEPESDRCAAKRIEQKRVEKSVRVQRRCWIRADFLCGVCG